ncbi:MAG: ribitol-5-phosphate 2-dehydrogenase / D-ribitol-5-phosphate cytidylyltransferase, partial [Nocardioidaceae bacterium]|nr:ribitol-5-phosphate 2-dehydrogenase / D-ribitol-5-phosphate cytidylyltransferase [Nocardioidaceae bacterium]
NAFGSSPMRTKAFGEEPAGSLLDSMSVARSSLDVLLSDGTGHVLDLRKLDPMVESIASTELA